MEVIKRQRENFRVFASNESFYYFHRVFEIRPQNAAVKQPMQPICGRYDEDADMHEFLHGIAKNFSY